jgi:ceramide glucosyltransferase
MMRYALLAACAAAFLYQVTALLACLRQMGKRDPEPPANPRSVSILKPIRGLDPGFFEAIRSHAVQQYRDFEMLFGISMPGDPAVAAIERLHAEYPGLAMRVVPIESSAPNGKVGTLAGLRAQAKHDLLLVSDSDIRVPPGYLAGVTAPLEDPGVGIVTCLYRASASSLPGIWEALGIATDFAPSTLVAPLVGVKEFGLGSTLVFRGADLDRTGGFEAIADYLADDYQLAKRITGAGTRAYMSRIVVETQLQASSWGEVWKHQVRWHRTIRVSRGAGYIGLPMTNATVWTLFAAASGLWAPAVALAGVRLAMALTAGVGVLRCPITARWFWLVPLRDLWGLAVWAAGLFGDTVEWRGQRLKLTKDGRILQLR